MRLQGTIPPIFQPTQIVLAEITIPSQAALADEFKEGKSGKFLRKSGRRPRKIGTCDHSLVPGMP
jgi:hypothetical protein